MVLMQRGGGGIVALSVSVSLCVFSRVQLFAAPWTVAYQVPLSVEFYRQEYWSGFPFSTPGYLPDPGIEPSSLVSPALAGFLPLHHLGSHCSSNWKLMVDRHPDCFPGFPVCLPPIYSSALGTMVTGGSNPVLIPSLFPLPRHRPSTHIHFAPALSWVLVMVLCGREVSTLHVGRMSTAP